MYHQLTCRFWSIPSSYFAKFPSSVVRTVPLLVVTWLCKIQLSAGAKTLGLSFGSVSSINEGPLSWRYGARLVTSVTKGGCQTFSAGSIWLSIGISRSCFVGCSRYGSSYCAPPLKQLRCKFAKFRTQKLCKLQLTVPNCSYLSQPCKRSTQSYHQRFQLVRWGLTSSQLGIQNCCCVTLYVSTQQIAPPSKRGGCWFVSSLKVIKQVPYWIQGCSRPSSLWASFVPGDLVNRHTSLHWVVGLENWSNTVWWSSGWIPKDSNWSTFNIRFEFIWRKNKAWQRNVRHREIPRPTVASAWVVNICG